MRNLRDLSLVIHDDHSSYWKKIPHKLWKKWLSPLDICLLSTPYYAPHHHYHEENISISFTLPPPQHHSTLLLKGNNSLNCSKYLPKTLKDQAHLLSLQPPPISSRPINLGTNTTTPTTTGQSSNNSPPPSLTKNENLQQQQSSSLINSYHHHPRLFCSVIYGLGYDCHAPNHPSREYYYKKLITLITGNKTIYSLKSTMKILAKSHKSLIFIGDSLTKQNFQALFCEILKIDSTVSISGDVYHPQNITIRWLNKQQSTSNSNQLSMNLHYLPFHGLFDSEDEKDEKDGSNNDVEDGDDDNNEIEDEKERKKSKKQRDKEKEEEKKAEHTEIISQFINTTSDSIELKGTSGGGDSTIGQNDKNSTISVVGLGSSRYQRSLESESSTTSSHSSRSSSYDFNTIKHIVSYYQEIYSGGLVIVLNIGASYTSRMKYRQDIGEILEWFDKLGDISGKKNIIMYRETAAQHWNHTSYGYPMNEESLPNEDNDEGDGSNNIDDKPLPSNPPSFITSPQHHTSLHSMYQPYSQCVPITDYTPIMDWKNYEVKSCLKNNDYSNIYLLPFHDITAPLYSMHLTPPGYVGGGDTNHTIDCTHYCYFPQMWESIWTTFSYVITNHMKINQTKKDSFLVKNVRRRSMAAVV